MLSSKRLTFVTFLFFAVTTAFRLFPVTMRRTSYLSMSTKERQFDDFKKKSNNFIQPAEEAENIFPPADLMSSSLVGPKYNQVHMNQFADGELTIFVVDMSMPGAAQRINSVKGAVGSIQPKGKVAVIGCSQGGASVLIEPTSSVVSTSRGMTKLKKSVMGNVGRGFNMALEIAHNNLIHKRAKHVSLVVLADSKAHGLKSGPTECSEDICDLELMDAADTARLQGDAMKDMGYNFDTIIIDTEQLDHQTEWSEEGLNLARVSGAVYYHIANLTPQQLLSILYDVKYPHKM